MSTVSQPDPYDSVLADLHAQRDRIDQTIALLNALRGGVSAPAPTPVENGIVETAGMFLGMSIVDASKKLLHLRKRTMGNPEIAKELQAGGLVFSGKEPPNVIGSVLTRRFNDVGDVVKVGRGIWGLKEWYPGRNFKAPAKATSTAHEGDNPVPDVDDPTPLASEQFDTLSDEENAYDL